MKILEKNKLQLISDKPFSYDCKMYNKLFARKFRDMFIKIKSDLHGGN